jgi:hypothetical protein
MAEQMETQFLLPEMKHKHRKHLRPYNTIKVPTENVKIVRKQQNRMQDAHQSKVQGGLGDVAFVSFLFRPYVFVFVRIVFQKSEFAFG